jgi:hypothetical protein
MDYPYDEGGNCLKEKAKFMSPMIMSSVWQKNMHKSFLPALSIQPVKMQSKNWNDAQNKEQKC